MSENSEIGFNYTENSINNRGDKIESGGSDSPKLNLETYKQRHEEDEILFV